MTPQLRIDKVQQRGPRLTLDYSHDLDGTLPPQPQGYGCTWESLVDLREQLQQLIMYLGQPETLLLLSLLGPLSADPDLEYPERLLQRILTFDPADSTTPFLASGGS